MWSLGNFFGRKRLFAHVYRTTPVLQSLCAQLLWTAGSQNTSMARPGLDLMCKCKPHTTAQSQELVKTRAVWALKCPHSLIQMEKAKRYSEVSSVNQKTPRWGAGRNGTDLGRMIPIRIKAKRLESHSSDFRIRTEGKSEMHQYSESFSLGAFL